MESCDIKHRYEITEVVRKFIENMNNKDIKSVGEMVLNDALFIRPSGNPLSKQNWINMFNSNDLIILSNRLLHINRVDIGHGGDWAYVCYTTHSRFIYKGKKNDDISVFSVVFKRGRELYSSPTWKLLYLQRSMGRSPYDKMPKF